MMRRKSGLLISEEEYSDELARRAREPLDDDGEDGEANTDADGDDEGGDDGEDSEAEDEPRGPQEMQDDGEAMNER